MGMACGLPNAIGSERAKASDHIPEISSPSASELTEQSPVDPGHDLGQVLRN
jgi:hypothetical protein